MNAYMHILVGLDLSTDCNKILTKANNLAKTNAANITVAHVFEPLALAYGGDLPIDLAETQHSIETQAKKRMKDLCEPFGIPTSHQLICIGLTAPELHNLAEEKQADLIVVGSHGRHGLAALFGNTANGVIRGAKCDVLAIRI